MSFRLTRTRSAGVYFVVGEPTIMVSSWKQMAGRSGNRCLSTTWTARFRDSVPRTDSFGLIDIDLSHIAKGATLANLRTNLERYLTDEKTSLQPRRAYGFSGDQRPSATRPNV